VLGRLSIYEMSRPRDEQDKAELITLA